jgi:hypothetical protein
LPGLAVVGVPFGGVDLVHLVDITGKEEAPFLFLLTPRHLHSDNPVRASNIAHLQSMLAHWDHLPKGGRLRRGARLYWRIYRKKTMFSPFRKPTWALKHWSLLLPWKSCKVIIGHVVPKIVEQQEWIKLRRVAEPKRAAQMHASAFERWFGFDQALDRAYRHSCSPVSRVGVGRAAVREPYGSAVDRFR